MRLTMRLTNTLAALLLGSGILSAANPLLPDLSADASVRVFDGKTAWLYCTHDQPQGGPWTTYDFHAYSSSDLVHWTDHGIAFQRSDIKWESGRNLWAPDCINRNGKYYLYYAVPCGKTSKIGVAVSDKPEGPFVDPLGKPLILQEEIQRGRAIDPNVFIDDDGQAYLYFGNGKFYAVKLKEDMITRDGDIIPLDVEDPGEGPWVHKRNGIYYLSYPAGKSKGPSKNQVMVYSTSTNPLGPWEYRGPIIMDNGGGNIHGSIVPFGSMSCIFYHRLAKAPGLTWQREVCADYLEYNPDGSIKAVTPTSSGVEWKH